jgi:hypothetical protein
VGVEIFDIGLTLSCDRMRSNYQNPYDETSGGEREIFPRSASSLRSNPIRTAIPFTGSFLEALGQDLERSHPPRNSDFAELLTTKEDSALKVHIPNDESQKGETAPDKPTLHAPNAPLANSVAEKISDIDINRLRTEWERIDRSRKTVWALRSRLQQQRAILRSKQYAKSIADDKYMRHVRLMESARISLTLGPAAGTRDSRLEELLQDCENTRAEYGPLEDDCNLLEDDCGLLDNQLGSQEFELTRLEEQFFKRWRQSSTVSAPETVNPQTPLDEESIDDSSDEEQEFHPLVAEYLSKLGDVEILRERLEWHRDEKFALQSEKDTREKVDLRLASDDQSWLDESGEIEDGLLVELKEAELAALVLKEKCLAKKLIDENDEPKDFFHTREEDALSDDDVDAKGLTSEYSKFPTLLPQWENKRLDFYTSAPKPDEFSHNAGDHINQWLLHMLRLSPLDVSLLARTFEDVGGVIGEDWQLEVLRLWYNDGAVKDAAGYRVYSAAATTTTDTPAQTRKAATSIPERKYQIAVGATMKSTTSESRSDSRSVSEETTAGNGLLVEPFPGTNYPKKGN